MGAERRDHYFEWTEVPGAASYVLEVERLLDSVLTCPPRPPRTRPLPPSATGKYTWSVTADAAGQAIRGTSATRAFKVDATAPIVTKVSPATLKPTSTIKVKFSEKVKGISKKSIKLYRLKGEKQKKVLIKTKVKSLKKGKAASVDPKGRLKHGDYLLLFKTNRLKDKAGNRLVGERRHAGTARGPRHTRKDAGRHAGPPRAGRLHHRAVGST